MAASPPSFSNPLRIPGRAVTAGISSRIACYPPCMHIADTAGAKLAFWGACR